MDQSEMDIAWKNAFGRTKRPLPASMNRYVRNLLHNDVPSFMELPIARKPSDLKGMDVVFMGYPYEGVTIESRRTYVPAGGIKAGPESIYHRTGADMAPDYIRKYSVFCSVDHSFGYYPEVAKDFVIFDRIKAVDYGDVLVDTPLEDPEPSFNRCVAKVGDILEAGATPLVLGGDHATPAPVITALSKRTKGNIGIIVFDSHYDVSAEPPYYAGSQWAQVLALPNVKPRNLVLVGIRGLRNAIYEQFVAEELGIPVFNMGEIDRNGLEATISEAIRHASDGTDSLYLSLDIDVMDPAQVPAQKYPEPAGLSVKQMLAAIRQIGHKRRLSGFDLCCLGPQYDLPTGISSQTAARFFVEVLSTIAQHH